MTSCSLGKTISLYFEQRATRCQGKKTAASNRSITAGIGVSVSLHLWGRLSSLPVPRLFYGRLESLPHVTEDKREPICIGFP
jgi:hypothetical protein